MWNFDQAALAAGFLLPALCAVIWSGIPSGARSTKDGWSNSLRPAGAPAPPLTLARDGRTDYAIVTPARATPQEAKAADLLETWLREITGATFPVVADTAAPAAREISVGRTNRLSADAPGLPPDLGEEGYAIAVDGERVLLAGGSLRGPIYAALALLEEDLGCRWYTPRASRVVRRPTLEASIVPRSYVPVLALRDPFYEDAFDPEWSLMNRTNSHQAPVPEDWGGHLGYPPGWFVHTASRLVGAEHFEAHPEYLAMIDGERSRHRPDGHPLQLCLTNPDVGRIATAKVLEVLDANPRARLISVSPSDGGSYCQCQECSAVDEAEGSGGAALLRFVNLVAEAVAERHPRVRVVHLAYLGTDTMPATLRPRPNVVVMFATDHDAWRWPFIPYARTKVTRERLAPWIEMGSRVFVWDYVTNFSHYSLPMPNMKVVEQNLHFLVEAGVEGVFLQGAYQSPGSARGAMRAWVWAKKLWDPSRDLRALMRDFTRGYYGDAAPPLLRYNDLLWQLHDDYYGHFEAEYAGGLENLYDIRYDPDVVFLSREFLDAASELFSEAEELAQDDETLRRVRAAKLSVLYARLCRGPDFGPEDYGAMIDEFAAIARAEGVQHTREGAPDIEEKILLWRELQAGERKP